MLDGFTRAMAPLETLSPEELETIHSGALFTLEKTGMRIESDRGLDLFESAGCRVDREEMRVRIPAWLVEECLRLTPTKYILKARDGHSDLMVGGDTLYFMQGMGMNYVDLDTWETRPATLAEPSSAGMKQVRMRMVVVLPAPLGPRKAVTAPSGTLSERRSTAGNLRNRLVSWSNSMIGFMAGFSW